jgi:uncharacterized protein YyaL (SSP411 family)
MNNPERPIRRNQLANESSPYLLQHADNPVDWYPWGEEALERARREDKPILLSIGYSACHWCHVMAHESFEDPDTASVMNERFVNIKLDREERPDLDKIYQLAHQMLTGRPGGWPLNMFLDPHSRVPFFGGTYFPKAQRYNLPAFVSVLQRVSDYYHTHKEQLAQHSASLQSAMQSFDSQDGAQNTEDLDAALLAQAHAEIDTHFDPEYGGFGAAPKFPHPTTLEFLLRYWSFNNESNTRTLHLVTHTLEKMAEGGIYDQVGGGFYRYSVDARWQIPHFEKMLYDNGPLLILYTHAWQATGNQLFRRIAIETAEWVMREMQAPTGGYFSTLDADSEGEEGKFYVWHRDEVKHLLTDSEFEIVTRHYGLDQTPNFEGHWHLHVAKPLTQVADALQVEPAAAEASLMAARQKMLKVREQRVHPGRDEKILMSWNALMAKGMAIAGRIFERQDFIDSAFKAIDSAQRTLWHNTRLLATYKDGNARLNAYLDDYAFLMDALLELLQTRWRTADLTWAVALADTVLERFEDKDGGGFFFTSDDHESLIYRPKPMMDEALPAGNGVAAYSLGRLGSLLGNLDYLAARERAVVAAAPSMRRVAYAHGTLLIALEEMLRPPRNIVLRGEAQAMRSWECRLKQPYDPRRLCFAIPDGITDLPYPLSERKPDADVTAYVCTETSCLPPAKTLEALEALL